MQIDPRRIPALDPACRLTVIVPAKNEAASISLALEALVAQRALDGRPFDRRAYDIVVLCNDCTDDTAAIARRFSTRADCPLVHVLEATLPKDAAHVGTARRALLDLACRRYLGAGRRFGILASTDADSCVDERWIAHTIAEMTQVDAVAGHVEIASAERDRMLAPLRLLYDRECTYRRLLGELEAREDPRPFDPAPRHDAFVGASFAVGAATYVAAGGLSPKARLEDQAFAQQLARIDARVRHSYAVRVTTSARLDARVEGGFASFIANLTTYGERRETYPVLAARQSLALCRARAAFRRIATGRPVAEDAALVSAFFVLDAAALQAILAAEPTFGAAFARALAVGTPRVYPDEPVESVIAQLRAALEAEKPAAPTLAKTASGAG